MRRRRVPEQKCGGQSTHWSAATRTCHPGLDRGAGGMGVDVLGASLVPRIPDQFSLNSTGELLRSDIPNSYRAAVLFLVGDVRWRCSSDLLGTVPRFLHFWREAHVLPFMLLCVEPRVIWRRVGIGF